MKLGTRDRTLLVAVATIGVVAAFYMFVLKPQHRQVAQLDRSVATARAQLAGVEANYASGRAAQRQLRASVTDFAAAQRAVPEQSDIPSLLRVLQRTADAADVSIEQINLSPSGAGSTPGAGSTTSASTSSSGSTTGTNGSAAGTSGASGAVAVQTVPVSLTIAGGYQALHRMVSQLDTLVAVSHGGLRVRGPLVGIDSVTLGPNTSTGAGHSQGLSVQLSATIYQRAGATSASASTSQGSS